MRQSLIPVLILATVALSSSIVLPLNHLQREPTGFDGQHDNTFSNRYQTRNILDDLFYKIYAEHQNRRGFSKADLKYASMDNGDDDIFSIMSKNDNYDGEGFRQEQWHNYPRQLDRLHGYEHKRNFDPDPDNDALADETAPDIQNVNDITNEFRVDSNAGTNKVYDAEIAANPLLIKIQLAYLNQDIDNNQYVDLMSTYVGNSRKEDEKDEFTIENPSMNVGKVKREETVSPLDSGKEHPTTESKAVKKRIFSLWSRLQSLNHKGHELHHRRHLHAFYSLPDSDGGGGGALTAEPRAILMRPPGSPLRWG